MPGRHNIGHNRLARRLIEGKGGRPGRRQQVEQRQRRLAGQGHRRQQRREDGRRRLCPNQQLAPVQAVGQHATQQGKQDHRDDAHQPQRAQP